MTYNVCAERTERRRQAVRRSEGAERPSPAHGYVPSQLIPGDIKRPVKYTEDIHVAVRPHEICDAVVTVEEDSHISSRSEIAVPDLRMRLKDSRALVNAENDLPRSYGVLFGDVLEDAFQPARCFFSPGYPCHDRIRRSISSELTVRLASESAKPLSTMMWNASSRTSSSEELSSG